MKTYPRPRRRFDAAALALDAPLPLIVTCAGHALPWPSGSRASTRREGHDAPDVRPVALCRVCGGYVDACQCSAPSNVSSGLPTAGCPPPEWEPDTEETGPDLFASDNFDAWPTLAQRLAQSLQDDRAA
jgi:hypothetical protein